MLLLDDSNSSPYTIYHTPIKNWFRVIRSALNPFTSKICFSNNKEFPKIKMTQVSQARPELSEN